MEPSTVDSFSELVRSGGPVLIACVVTVIIMCAVVFMGYRFIVGPALKEQSRSAKSNEEAAKFYTEAAKYHAEASRNNARTSEGNAQTSAHLERMMRMLFEVAVAPDPKVAQPQHAASGNPG